MRGPSSSLEKLVCTGGAKAVPSQPQIFGVVCPIPALLRRGGERPLASRGVSSLTMLCLSSVQLASTAECSGEQSHVAAQLMMQRFWKTVGTTWRWHVTPKQPLLRNRLIGPRVPRLLPATGSNLSVRQRPCDATPVTLKTQTKTRPA